PYQDYKADILRVYNSDEARRLKKMKELPNDTKIDVEDNKKTGNDGMPFDSVKNDDVDEEDEGQNVGQQPRERYQLPTYFDYDEITVSDEEEELNGMEDGYVEQGGKKKVDLNEL